LGKTVKKRPLTEKKYPIVLKAVTTRGRKKTGGGGGQDVSAWEGTG